jgi:hypothetical protein
MTHPVDVHPEDLLDRERRGLLVPDERRRLDAHAAHCRACALERNVVFEFARERKVGRGDDGVVSRLVLGTVAVAAEMANVPRQSEFRLKKRSGFRRWALMSAVAAAGTGAFLAGSVWLGPLRENRGNVATPVVVTPSRPSPPMSEAPPPDPRPAARVPKRSSPLAARLSRPPIVPARTSPRRSSSRRRTRRGGRATPTTRCISTGCCASVFRDRAKR